MNKVLIRFCAAGMIAAAAATLGKPVQPALAQIEAQAESGPWLWVSRTSSAPSAVASGQVKGEITVTTNAGRAIQLKSLSNGDADGYTSSPNQCPALIVRYSEALGYGSSSVGDGKDAASAFASRSRGQFSYQVNGQSSQPPVPGAVISISGLDNAGNPFAEGYGHVGIVQKVTGSSTSLEVTLFDQNWPTSYWKTASFRKVGGSWQGTFQNAPSKKPVQIIAVAGWANPVVATTKPRTPPAGTPRAKRPDTPGNLLPGQGSAPGTALPGKKITMTWGSVAGATGYDLKVRDMTDKRSAASETLTSSYYSLKVKSGHTYRWSVRACNDAGCSAESADLYFTAK